ncbi:unnamed protein product [Dracunculus medinensis]|uniref:PNP_UDP_1 domain-containing protein n=1 Tax=Dracunculus medinensis TaxID=318479 RepID=A0A0N4U268_DRAME|nr:unnamed protein product [Dracunculus medinensis]
MSVPLLNPILTKENKDFLYHLGIEKSTTDLPKRFGDVKFVCTGGSSTRLALYAKWFAKDCGLDCSENLCNGDRFVMYKTGPVLWINVRIGVASLSIVLIEVIKLLHYAKAVDVTFFRIGTCGGIGIPPGTLVISTSAVNGELKQEYVQYIMGKRVTRPAILDENLRKEIGEFAQKIDISVVSGKTMACDDFYEGQARLDGAFCDYTANEKTNFLNHLKELGIRNIEMESVCFAALLHRANIKAAIVCVTLIDRTKGDQIKINKLQYEEFESKPFNLIKLFIRQKLNI